MKLLLKSVANHWRRRFGPYVVWIDGAKVDIRHISSLSVRLHLLKGHYQREERSLLDFAVVDGDSVVELGVGIGLLGLIAARLAGPSGRVFSCSFDTASENIARRNYTINEISPKLVPISVGQDVQDHFSSESCGSRNLKSNTTEFSGMLDAVVSNELSSVLDQFRPNVLLVDLRGYENGFFRFDPLNEVQRILVKIHPKILGLKRCQELEVLLVEKGFYVFGRMGDSVLFKRV